MKFLLVVLIAFVLVEEGISLDAFDIVDKYCAAKNQDDIRKCMADNGKSKLFTFFDFCARPLRRHIGNAKETSKFVCKEANEKEDFMFRCCLGYQMKRSKDSSLTRVFEGCLKRGSSTPMMRHTTVTSRPVVQQQSYMTQPWAQQSGFLSQSSAQQKSIQNLPSVQQQSFMSQSPLYFDESAVMPYVY